MDSDAVEAEEFRNTSLETFGEMTNRLSEDKEDHVVRKKGRKSALGSETIAYLREKTENETLLRKEEIGIRKAELEDRRNSQDSLQKLIIEQQKQ